MKCKYSIEELIGYMDGRMCDEEKDALNKHLEICENCRSHIGILRITESHINEDVKNDGSTYAKVMKSIDKDRYSGNKSKYKIGSIVFKLAPAFKPVIAALLIIIFAVAAVNNQQQISSVLSAIGEVISGKHDANQDEDKKDKYKESKFFKAEPVIELAKGKPAEGWVLSEDRVIDKLSESEDIRIKLYVQPDPNPASSKTSTGEVRAFLQDGSDLFDLGVVGGNGTGDVGITAQDLNNDSLNEISIKGTIGAASVQFKVVGREVGSGRWIQWLNTDYTEIMDIDNDGKTELITTSVGSTPSFVWIYRWNEDHFEKMDVAEATDNEYARIVNKGENNILFESGKANKKCFYQYKDGELIEYRKSKNVLEKDKVTDVNFNTCVSKEVWGKLGPGDNYENVIKIPYGRIISVIGRYTINGGNGGWYLAHLTPELTDERTTITLPENQTEFWISFESIQPGYEYQVDSDNCTVNDAVRFNSVITSEDEAGGTINLKQIPEDKSPTVSIADKGNLIEVIRKDEKWSLVRITSGRAMSSYSDVGWIQNDRYTAYKPGLKVNQGFITRPFRVYENPDTTSNYVPLDDVIKSNIAPVTIDESKSTKGWNYIHGGFNGWAGWVKNEDIKSSFTSDEAFKLANPEVDLVVLTNKIKDEIEGWEDLNLCALDIGKQIKLSSKQRKDLSDKLISVTGYDVFDGGLTSYREAEYPFYTLQFLDGNNDFYVAENSDELPNKYYRLSFCKFNFIVTGEDTLMIQIPADKLDLYGIGREGPPVKFIKVNKEFIEYFKALIPSVSNDDTNSLNYLLKAVKVEVDSQTGELQQQVYKAARVLQSFKGSEVNQDSKPLDGSKVMEFKFTFGDGSTEKVDVYNKYLSYKGKYFALNGPPALIGGYLFTGYF